MDTTVILNNLNKGGAAFKTNGKDAEVADVLAFLKTADPPLDASDMAMIDAELQAALDEMRYRNLPNQAKPEDPGLHPTLDIRIPGNHGQAWSIGSTWN